MANEIIPYAEMCRREASSLQRGMNFNLGKGYSVILMFVRPNAPYRDRFGDDGSTIIYEGHDVPRSHPASKPKAINQSSQTPSGRLTENGKFYQAAEAFKRGDTQAHAVRVYEKIHPGIWSYNGVFSSGRCLARTRRQTPRFQVQADRSRFERGSLDPT